MVDPGGSGSFMERFLGDLFKVMGGPAGPPGARVDIAREFARSVAAGGGATRPVEPLDRIVLEELARLAEMHVTEITGLDLGTGGRNFEVVTVVPADWAAATIEDWRYLLEALTAGPSAATGAGPAGAPDLPAGAEPDGEPGLNIFSEEFATRMFSSLAPMMAALQMGSAVGNLAQSALGPYEFPIPRATGGRLLVVPANLTRFAADWSLDAEQVRLWVCVRELTVAGVFARPHVAERLRGLFETALSGALPDLTKLGDVLGGLDPSNPEALEQLMGSPETLLAVEPSPERVRAAAELSAVTAALLGYVDHVGEQAAARLLGGGTQLGEAWRRIRAERSVAGRETEEFFALDLSVHQLDRGRAFVKGVLERGGEAALAQLWTLPYGLPTPNEIEAPGLWLERVSLGPPAGEDGGATG